MESKPGCAGSELYVSPRLNPKTFTLCWCCLSLASGGFLLLLLFTVVATKVSI